MGSSESKKREAFVSKTLDDGKNTKLELATLASGELATIAAGESSLASQADFGRRTRASDVNRA